VLDRAQWRIGTREVNFLVLAAVTRRYRVPLLWTLIPGRGNSSTRQRIALMRRYPSPGSVDAAGWQRIGRHQSKAPQPGPSSQASR